jgi:hypothetical protein
VDDVPKARRNFGLKWTPQIGAGRLIVSVETASQALALVHMHNALIAAVSAEGRVCIDGRGRVVIVPDTMYLHKGFSHQWRIYHLCIREAEAHWAYEDRDQHGNLYSKCAVELADPDAIDKLCEFIEKQPQAEPSWFARCDLWLRRKFPRLYNRLFLRLA